MKWILIVLDKVFGNLFGGNEWFRRLAERFTENVESTVYNIEAGNADWASLAEKLGRVVRWIPVVFLVCLIIDIVIRSRFVRYSYRDEQQAQKTNWWQWQSDVDAAVALESAARQGELAEHAGEDGVTAESEETAEEAAPVREIPAAEEEEIPEEEIDRGPIVNARQNRVRGNAALSERVRGRVTDMRNRAIVAASAVKFAPAAIRRDMRLRNERVRSAANLRTAAQEERKRFRNSSEQELAAENAAVLDTELQNTVMDGDFTTETAVETGGIRGYSFGTASAVISEALGSWAADPEQEEAETPAPAEAEEIPAEETDAATEEPFAPETEEEPAVQEIPAEEPAAEPEPAEAEEPVEETEEFSEEAEEVVEETEEISEEAEEPAGETEPVEAAEEAEAEETVQEEIPAEAAAEMIAEPEQTEEIPQEETAAEEAEETEEVLPEETTEAVEVSAEGSVEETEEIPAGDPPFIEGAAAVNAELQAVEELLADEAPAGTAPAEETPAAQPRDVDDVEDDVEHLAQNLEKLRRGISGLFKKKKN